MPCWSSHSDINNSNVGEMASCKSRGHSLASVDTIQEKTKVNRKNVATTASLGALSAVSETGLYGLSALGEAGVLHAAESGQQ